MMELRLECMILDRVLDGDDVIAAVSVDQVHQRGQRGAFSTTGGAGDQHQALPGFGQLAQAGGEVKGFESRDFFRKQPEAARDGPALIVNIGAEAADAFAAETQIRGSVFLQILGLGRSHQREQQMPRFLGAQRRTRGGRKHASDAQRRRSPGDQQEIGGSAANGVDQQGIERGKTFGSGQRRHIGRNRLASAGGGAIQFGDDFGKIFVETRHASKIMTESAGQARTPTEQAHLAEQADGFHLAPSASFFQLVLVTKGSLKYCGSSTTVVTANQVSPLGSLERSKYSLRTVLVL